VAGRGCNIAFDKTTLMAAGGFSRSNDELEVMERIRATGRISIYEPAATVEHVIDPARLTREWFRRRAAWQAVSDFIQDPKRAAASAPISL
jgi:glucosyl-dolichyl phosphate glucuronosyltransferase